MFDDDICKNVSPERFVAELESRFGEAAWVAAYLFLKNARTKQAQNFAEELLALLGREVMIETTIPPLLAAEAFNAYVENPISVVDDMIEDFWGRKKTYTYYFLTAMIAELKAMSSQSDE